MVSRRKLTIAGVVIAIAIIIMFAAIYVVINNEITSLAKPVTVSGPISISGSVYNAGIASYNYTNGMMEYARVSYNISNAIAVNFTLVNYLKNPVFHIYLVNASNFSCYRCFNNQNVELYADMKTYLYDYGLLRNSSSIQNISLSALGEIPNGSMVIFPTGLFPGSALPGTQGLQIPGTQNITLINLLDRHDYVFYIGDDFSRTYSKSNIYDTGGSTTNDLRDVGITTTPFYNNTNTSLVFDNPTFAFTGGNNYGAVGFINILNGTLISISNTPIQSWKNVSSEASDIVKLIQTRIWIPIIAQGSSGLLYGSTLPTTGNTTVISTESVIRDYPQSSNVVNASYSLVQIKVYNQTIGIYKELPFRFRFAPNGTLGLPEIVGYNTPTLTKIQVNSKLSHQSFNIRIYAENTTQVASIPVGSINTSFATEQAYSLSLPTGQLYIASLIDINGKHYGDSLFYVPDFNVTGVSADFKNGTFGFKVESYGQPVTGLPYQIGLGTAYNQTGTTKDSEILYTLPKGTAISYGIQPFIIKLLNKYYLVEELYAQPPGVPPFYIEFGVAGVVIILLNLLLHAPNREEYYIDVPELPPTKKAPMSVRPEVITNLFDTINYHYHWKYMPLTAEEIKAGISSNIRSGNTAVSITLQNTNEVLYTMSNMGEIQYKEDYYMPKRWAAESRHDIEYLTIFRKMRDFFVEHAILFTDLDASAGVDVTITSKNKQVPIFIYSSESGIRKVIATPNAKAFIVFLNRATKEEFEDKIDGSIGRDVELLRLAIESSSIQLIDAEHLDELL